MPNAGLNEPVISTKTLILGWNHGTGVHLVSGAMFISGSRLWFVGDDGPRKVAFSRD